VCWLFPDHLRLVRRRNANAYSRESYADGNSDGHCNTNGNSDGHGDPDGNSDGYTYKYTATDSDTETGSDSTAAPDPVAVMGIAKSNK
jgi:hypothetical protein